MKLSHLPSFSLDAGASTLPSERCRHLFFTGPLPLPVSPGTTSSGLLQVRPLSAEVLNQECQKRTFFALMIPIQKSGA